MAYITDGRLVENFTLAEMTNKQAKDTIKLVITPAVVRHAQMMQELRKWYNKSMTVNSWYRTKSFNASCGGNAKSPHLNGTATDIAFPNLTEQHIINFNAKWKAICEKWGVVGGISIYKWGLHFDSNSDVYGLTSFRVNDYR